MSANRIIPTQNQLKIANHSGTNAGSLVQRSAVALLLFSSLFLSVSVCAQTSGPTAPSGAHINNSRTLKLPVAHAHFGSWCMGYLTITPDGVRYDVVRAQGKDEHSFQLKREQVTFLNYWVVVGQPINAVELRAGNKNYHFWLLRSDADLQSGARWKPVAAAPSDTLLLSLYYWRVTGNVPNLAAVNAALIHAKAQSTAGVMARATPSGNGSVNGDPYEKMSQHIYADANSYTSTVNQINSINHMSHW